MMGKLKEINFCSIKKYLISLGWTEHQYKSHKTYFTFKHSVSPDKIMITLTNDVYDELYLARLDNAIRILAHVYKKEVSVLVEEFDGVSFKW